MNRPMGCLFKPVVAKLCVTEPLLKIISLKLIRFIYGAYPLKAPPWAKRVNFEFYVFPFFSIFKAEM